MKTHCSPSLATLFMLLATSVPRAAHAIQTISAVGSKFFYEDGRQYYIKGIAYQLVPDDPLIDTAQCTRDAARMAELGTNAIRVYHVDPEADHDGCMKAFEDAGIYLFVDLDTFDTAISQVEPHWDQTQHDRFAAVLDEFQQYNNTAGFFVGNEVLTTKDGSAAAPYVLAAVRDMKSHRDEKGYRPIPVGYSAADIAELRPMLQNYLACRSDPAERLDFFALNAYEWCGESTFTQSGYESLQKQAEGYPAPIFFSETGCNVARPRTFGDQAAIFGPEMADTWSGSMIYEWIEETNDYGLVNYGPPPPPPAADAPAAATANGPLVQDGFVRQGEPTPVAPDFDNLKAQWATLNPTGVALSDYAASTSTITPPACPASTAGGWAVDPSAPLPTLGQA
ncbi:glycolipid anchored surface protein GAS1, partial [Aspergillus violaceofuscus CBS 115571]